MRRTNIFIFLGIIALCAASICTVRTSGTGELSFKRFKKDGIVPGFGISNGDPLRFRDRIPRINDPKYVFVNETLYESNQLCVGINIQSNWYFSPISILNSREIVNHSNAIALCYCPLAGLVVALKGDISISGLLKYDTFLLVENKKEEIILPFTQSVYEKEGFVPLENVQLLNFSGLIKNFPKARILDPNEYSQRNPYGRYANSDVQGIGHEKPGLKKAYDQKEVGFHPKELVLIAGFDGKLQRAYPFAELKKSVPQAGGSIEDVICEKKVHVFYYPQYQWAYVKNEENQNLNLAYTYIFSMLQHLPKIPIYKKREL